MWIVASMVVVVVVFSLSYFNSRSTTCYVFTHFFWIPYLVAFSILSHNLCIPWSHFKKLFRPQLFSHRCWVNKFIGGDSFLCIIYPEFLIFYIKEKANFFTDIHLLTILHSQNFPNLNLIHKIMLGKVVFSYILYTL